jgi:hypothetical protein
MDELLMVIAKRQSRHSDQGKLAGLEQVPRAALGAG